MSKKEIVNQIKKRLTELGVTQNGCQNLNILIRGSKDLVAWVGYTQIMVSKQIKPHLYRNKRYALYSKDVDIDLLTKINKKLSKKITKHRLIGYRQNEDGYIEEIEEMIMPTYDSAYDKGRIKSCICHQYDCFTIKEINL